MDRPRFGVVAAAMALAGCGTAASKQEQSFEPTEAELVTAEGDRDVIPAIFRGVWAADRSTCQDPDGKGVLRITAGRISGYESDAVLIKNALAFERGPGGQQAFTLMALTAQSGEGEMGFEELRISRSQDRLYFSRRDAKDEAHWANALIRCPGPAD